MASKKLSSRGAAISERRLEHFRLWVEDHAQDAPEDRQMCDGPSEQDDFDARETARTLVAFIKFLEDKPHT